MRRAACAVAFAFLVAGGPGAAAATTPASITSPGTTAPALGAAQGSALEAPFPPANGSPRLTEPLAVERFLAVPKVARWLDRYPTHPSTDATFDRATRRWTVHVWSGQAGEVARGKVGDGDGIVSEAWTGPQVAWKMARGRPGAFGGEVLNSWWTWLPLSALFLIGLVDRRRLVSLYTLDLLALLSFGFSLWLFNRGEVFRSAPLAVPPLAYLLARMAWIGFRGRARTPALSWPVWALAGVAVFVGGFRVGLNAQSSGGVIDVGYAGVIGADRILHGQAPYGHMPVEDELVACGRADSDGQIRDRIQANGRCESANARGDTYGPVAYLAYVPGVLWLGWSGKWDSLPAAHVSAIGFDLLVVLGLVLVGRRFGGTRLAVTLAFGWLAYPFTAYTMNANTNDAIMPACLVWGFWLASSDWARGTAVALAGWTKFAAFLLAPLWLAYPDGLRRGTVIRFAAAVAAVTAAALSVLLLEPDLVEAGRTFIDRTIGFQLGRESPFSPWDWGQYHARGIPDLAAVQTLLQLAVLALAGIAAVIPARKGPRDLAALTAAILLGFELVLTHWSYLYIPWFLPFVLLALTLHGRKA